MASKLRKWDSAEHLKSGEDVALYFEACLEEAGDDAAFIAKALGNIARAGAQAAWRSGARLISPKSFTNKPIAIRAAPEFQYANPIRAAPRPTCRSGTGRSA